MAKFKPERFAALLVVTLAAVATVGCNESPKENFKQNRDPSKLKWKFGHPGVNWKSAYESCESLAASEKIPWRLATVNEIHQNYNNSPLTPATDNYVWSGLFNEQGAHYSVNLDNGAKQWRGDEILAHTLCVAGESTDKEAWIVEIYNAKLLGRPAHILAVVKDQAMQGNPRAQLEYGNMHLSGNIVPVNDAAAAKWYQLAAKNNEPMAIEMLAEMKKIGRLK